MKCRAVKSSKGVWGASFKKPPRGISGRPQKAPPVFSYFTKCQDSAFQVTGVSVPVGFQPRKLGRVADTSIRK